MSENTPHLALPYIMAAQAQKHVTHNEALTALDALVQLSATSRMLATPPADPTEGDRYIVGQSASGDWLGEENNLAAYQDGVWAFYLPQPGWRAWVADENRLLLFDGSDWQEQQTTTPFGAYTRLQTAEEELDLSGAVVMSTIQITDRAIVLGVSVLVVSAITGAISFDVGITGERSKFGGSLGINPGDTNIGVIGPAAFYAPTAIEVSANGGDFSAGTLRLVLHTIECGPPLL